MRKINQMVVANQEAFEYYNAVEEEQKPFWEVAAEDYEMHTRYHGYSKEDWEEEEFFWNQLRNYEHEHFEGKYWDEVDPMVRDVWSDLYKDVNGIRPYHIPFCCLDHKKSA